MDDEIKDALFELSSHQEEIVETSFHHTQENIQQTLVSSLVENEIDQDFIHESHFLSSEFDEDNQFNCYSFH